tara:strand:+ start:3711 stop:4118 length:408 start_codon:yes stop_codon:yes gene_type:complete
MKAAKILIADDGRVIRTAISRKLEEEGYAVTAVASGQETLEVMEHDSFDLVVLDIHMPGIDGIEALRQLRQKHSAVQLPVIMATAKDEDEDIVSCFEAGASDFVSKPINFPVLFARIDTHLRLKQAMEKLAQRNP